jgi:hypothetical protein
MTTKTATSPKMGAKPEGTPKKASVVELGKVCKVEAVRKAYPDKWLVFFDIKYTKNTKADTAIFQAVCNTEDEGIAEMKKFEKNNPEKIKKMETISSVQYSGNYFYLLPKNSILLF